MCMTATFNAIQSYGWALHGTTRIPRIYGISPEARRIIGDAAFHPLLLSLEPLTPLPTLPDGYLADWKPEDIVAVLIASAAGVLGTHGLTDYLAGLHDKSMRISSGKSWFGHGGEIIDKVPGNRIAGGPGHRWNYGHDLLNPFEVNWDTYLANCPGGKGSWLYAISKWVFHLGIDTFSREGLPLPLHSLFRQWLHASGNRQILQIVGTFKTRDLAGASLTNAIMAAYLSCTGGRLSPPDYRSASLMLMANVLTLIGGACFLPWKTASINWSVIPAIGYYGLQMLSIFLETRKILQQRSNVLLQNSAALARNDLKLEFALQTLINQVTYQGIRV